MRMRRPGFVGTAGAVAALILGAAGCAGDPEPRFAPPSGEASPSASESEESELTPAETVEAWVAARNGALGSGDVLAAARLQSADCSTCANLIEPIVEIYGNGGRFETNGWQLKNVSVNGNRVEADVLIAGGTTVSSAGAAPNAYKPEMRRMFVVLGREGAAWRIERIGFLV
ncbi:hypothetical protein GCM10009562_05560 [Nocardioides aquaticus]